MTTPNLATTHLRLQPNGRADQLPITATFWDELIAGKFGTFQNEYLVSHYRFEGDWDSEEVHPNGDEIVVLLQGSADFVLHLPAGEQRVTLRKSGDFAFVPMGTWHTANILTPSEMLFITAGEGTEGRPRQPTQPA